MALMNSHKFKLNDVGTRLLTTKKDPTQILVQQKLLAQRSQRIPPKLVVIENRTECEFIKNFASLSTNWYIIVLSRYTTPSRTVDIFYSLFIEPTKEPQSQEKGFNINT